MAPHGVRSLDGRPGRIDGHFLQGPFEAALVLHQQNATGPAESGLKP